MLLVITAIAERERSFIPDKIQNLKDQQVSKVNLEAKSLDSKVTTIPKVFLASKISKDLMKRTPQ